MKAFKKRIVNQQELHNVNQHLSKQWLKIELIHSKARKNPESL